MNASPEPRHAVPSWVIQVILVLFATVASYGAARVENEHRITLVEERVDSLRKGMAQLQRTTKEIQWLMYSLEPQFYRPEMRDRVRNWRMEEHEGSLP